MKMDPVTELKSAIAELGKEVKELRDIVNNLREQQTGTDRLLLNHLKVGEICPHTLKGG